MAPIQEMKSSHTLSHSMKQTFTMTFLYTEVCVFEVFCFFIPCLCSNVVFLCLINIDALET